MMANRKMNKLSEIPNESEIFKAPKNWPSYNPSHKLNPSLNMKIPNKRPIVNKQLHLFFQLQLHKDLYLDKIHL